MFWSSSRRILSTHYCCSFVLSVSSFIQPGVLFKRTETNEEKTDKEPYFTENNYSLCVALIALSVFVVLALCSRLCSCTLRLRRSGGRGALLCRRRRDPPVEPRPADGRRLLGGGAERTGGSVPLCAGGGSHGKRGDERGTAWRHTGTITPAVTSEAFLCSANTTLAKKNLQRMWDRDDLLRESSGYRCLTLELSHRFCVQFFLGEWISWSLLC